MASKPARKQFTVHEFYRMAEAGIIREDERVELLNGEVVKMSPIGSRHAACIKRLAELLRDRLGKKVLIGLQDPIRLDKFSEPQPDISVLIRRDDFYSGSHPTARDVYLLIEVAETSVEFDRTIKLDLYAQANIPKVWLIDLQNEAIEAYRDPRNKQYQGKDQLKRGQSLSSNALPELKLAVDDIFGAI